MTSLKQIQASFQKALLKGDMTILSHIPDTPAESNDVLLGVYQYAYKARLMEFLENDYPQLHAYLGDEQFADLAMAYIDKNPSIHPNARWYGQKLPEFVVSAPPYSAQAQLNELARLELALNTIFDEQDEPPLSLPQLAEIAPDQWPALIFTPVTATKRIDFTTNIAEIWNALVREETPPEIETGPQPDHFLIYRDEGQSSFRSMSYEEAMMWDKMTARVPFGILCELLATYGGEEDAALRAATYLQSWIMTGVIMDKIVHKS